MAFSSLPSLSVLAMLVFLGAMVPARASLSFGYYDSTCPFVEDMVKEVVDEELRKNPILSAGLLRMHFHDCFVEGCDGSVLIDSTNDNKAEKDSPANLSLRGFEIIDIIKEMVESRCEGIVSCADIVAMAARDAVSWSGGPSYSIPLGRKDGRRSRIEDTRNLPPPTSNSTSLINVFAKHGLTVQELVVLSGAHTIGEARCTSFKNRLSDKASEDATGGPPLNPLQAIALSTICDSGDNSEAPLDWTNARFDNAYYHSLEDDAGVLTSDQTLFESGETRGFVLDYASSEGRFFLDFSRAMVRMGLLDVKEEGDGGEVRRNCRKIN